MPENGGNLSMEQALGRYQRLDVAYINDQN